MYAFVGLGNPSKKYDKTRHNVGFETIDCIAENYNIEVKQAGFRSLFGTGFIEGEKVILVKPQTFMNLSGEAVRAVMDYFKLSPEEIIIIFDDISLEPGRLRVRQKGSAGGHNGMKNIILHVGTEDIPRVRVGIGEKPLGYDLADYVLSHFSKEESKTMKEAYERAAKAAICVMVKGPNQAMNEYNNRKEQTE